MTEDRNSGTPPLLLDAMLGRLATWLRLMGYDAAYLADTDDIEVVRLARAEARVLLTRDRGLAARRGVRAILIASQSLEEQLAQVIREIGPPPEPITPRCSVCNTPLEPLPREAARERVPPYVWRTQQTFTYCPGCHRVYWPGTHWAAIQRQLREIGNPSSKS
ncbi:MAG TPA: hypothetical protein ENI95_12790 [Chloroflexi bacterium]|nr:hypothetical protein [Chloroflexota bacterium]